MSKVGCVVNHRCSLIQGLLDHSVLLDVELHDSFLQVPNTTVDEFGTSGGGARSKVVSLYECCFQS